MQIVMQSSGILFLIGRYACFVWLVILLEVLGNQINFQRKQELLKMYAEFGNSDFCSFFLHPDVPSQLK